MSAALPVTAGEPLLSVPPLCVDVVAASSAVFDSGGVAANLTTLRDHLRNSRRLTDTTQDRGPA